VTRDALCWTLLVQHNGPMFTALTRAAVAALGLLTVVPSQARAQQSDSTLVAIVRADGVALPFARFDGRRWSPYPEPAEARARRFPQRFELPAVWAVHYANGSAKRTVRGGSSVVFNDESETWYEEWGQITDAPSRIGRDSYPLERAGLGVSGDALRAPAITFAEASARSPTWQVNRREVERAFRRAVDTVARELGPMRLRSLHIARSNVDGAQLFYVEGFAVQTPAPRKDCPPGVYYQAWFRRSASVPSVVHEDTRAGYDCDSPGAEPAKVVPFGVVRLAKRFFIAVELIEYEGGTRQLFELTRTSLTPSYPATP
jgi:hypothetical protein